MNPPKTRKNNPTNPSIKPNVTMRPCNHVTHPHMKLTSLTHLAFLINRIIDAEPDTDLSFREIFVAGCDGELIKLLAAGYGHLVDFSLLLSEPSLLEQMEAALRDAAS